MNNENVGADAVAVHADIMKSIFDLFESCYLDAPIPNEASQWLADFPAVNSHRNVIQEMHSPT